MGAKKTPTDAGIGGLIIVIVMGFIVGYIVVGLIHNIIGI